MIAQELQQTLTQTQTHTHTHTHTHTLSHTHTCKYTHKHTLEICQTYFHRSFFFYPVWRTKKTKMFSFLRHHLCPASPCVSTKHPVMLQIQMESSVLVSELFRKQHWSVMTWHEHYPHSHKCKWCVWCIINDHQDLATRGNLPFLGLAFRTVYEALVNQIRSCRGHSLLERAVAWQRHIRRVYFLMCHTCHTQQVWLVEEMTLWDAGRQMFLSPAPVGDLTLLRDLGWVLKGWCNCCVMCAVRCLREERQREISNVQ